MTFNQLQYALALWKYGNYNRAAESLEISQPALSLQIQKLEENVNLKLFNRSTTPIEVTEDGHLFLVKAQEVISGMRQLKNFAVEVTQNFNGTLRVGIIPTLAPFLVPLFGKSLSEDYPHLQLVIKEQTTENVVNNVRNGELDLGVISTPITVYGIKSIPLFYEKFYIYTSEESKESYFKIEDIDYNNLWLLEEGNCFRDQVNDFCDVKSIRKGKNFIYESNSIDSLIRIVDTQGGMTLLPELTTLSLNEYQEENLKEISGKPKAREIGLIVTPSQENNRHVALFKSYILDNIPKHMREQHNYEIVDPNINLK
jgi:LysR family hydrogen peroxide-inducible transcriptional activator